MSSSLLNQLNSLFLNVSQWAFFSLIPKGLRKAIANEPFNHSGCVVIHKPGGFEALQIEDLKDGQRYATVGYNVPHCPPPFVQLKEDLERSLVQTNLVVVCVKYFSINYADICIRWGLYESALRYVGWPIVPGFDFSGVVEQADKDGKFKIG